MKTNAIRILEQHGVAHRLLHYEVDPDDLTATTVAEKVGMLPSAVFKTLVCRSEHSKICFAIVPGDRELDLKVLAKSANARKVQPVALKDVQPLTGYVRGGVTVLGARKAFPVYLDKSAFDWDEIAVSAGVRGTQVLLAPTCYARVTRAQVVAALARSSSAPLAHH